jgi:hypothetical protein
MNILLKATVVMPAQAGIQNCQSWLPAFAGMTSVGFSPAEIAA